MQQLQKKWIFDKMLRNRFYTSTTPLFLSPHPCPSTSVHACPYLLCKWWKDVWCVPSIVVCPHNPRVCNYENTWLVNGPDIAKPNGCCCRQYSYILPVIALSAYSKDTSNLCHNITNENEETVNAMVLSKSKFRNQKWRVVLSCWTTITTFSRHRLQKTTQNIIYLFCFIGRSFF